MKRIAVVLSAALLGCAAVHAWAAPKTGWESVSETRFYTARPLATDDTINPMRGYHRWQNQELVPQASPALDSFRRYHWRDLESAEGQYNFTAILADLAAARQQGRKFAFRLRMMAGYDDDIQYGPAYLAGNAQCAAGCGFWADADPLDPGLTWVPDWNDPYLMARARALLAALAAAIGPTDAIAWIDVGIFGQYGEWALRSSVYASPPAGIVPVTLANKREYARMHFEAFPTQQLVMFVPYSNQDALRYGLLEQAITAKPVGLRVDCLGQYGYFNQWSNRPAEWAPFAGQWQKAPFVGEFCPFESGEAQNGPAVARQQAGAYHISSIGNGNFALSRPDAERWGSFTPAEQADLLMLGRESGYRYAIDKTSVALAGDGQLTLGATIVNHGSAPSYEPWTVQVELINGAGALAWSASLPATLGSLHGGGTGQALQGSWRLPALATGTYTLRLVARAPAAARSPMQWVVNERSADGGLTVRTLRRR
jgi:hypothetical protein